MIDEKIKELRGSNRRDFIRWTAIMGAALGLERSRLLNVLNDTGGTAMADTAAGPKSMFAVHNCFANGSHAWSTLMFPFKVQATDAASSFYEPGAGTALAGYDAANAMYGGSMSPFVGTKFKVSAFLCGNNETHTNTPMTAVTSGGNSLLAGMAALATDAPTVLPVITVGRVFYGTAAGSPAAAAVTNAQGMIDIFNSNVSNAFLKLQGNKALHQQYFKAFLGLNAAAGRSSVASQYVTAKIAAGLLPENLSALLTPTAAEEAILGITGAMNGSAQAIGRAMIIFAKAAANGLTNAVIVPGPNDDPHGAFAGGVAMPKQRTADHKAIYDGMVKLAGSLPDPGGSVSKTLADRLMFTWSGDTYKNPLAPAGWGDNTPGGSNILYAAMSNGRLKPGWFGDVTKNGNNGTPVGFDPATGLTGGAYNGGTQAQAAMSAMYFAFKGDADAARGLSGVAPGPGLIVNNLTG